MWAADPEHGSFLGERKPVRVSAFDRAYICSKFIKQVGAKENDALVAALGWIRSGADCFVDAALCIGYVDIRKKVR